MIIFLKIDQMKGFFTAGIGLSYKKFDDFDFYVNFSQNYRSVTFADISTVNPAYAIDPE